MGISDHTKEHQDHSNRPTDFSSMTKPTFYIQNGGHLEKGAIMDYQMATKPQERIPVIF